MGRAHGSSKQLQSAPPQSLAPTTSSAPTRGTDGGGRGGKAAASGAPGKKSLFDDDAGGGDDMFFDAKKSKDVKSGHRAVVKSGEHTEDVKLQVNQAFADKFAAVERLKDGMRLKSLEEKYGSGSGSSSGTPSSSSDEGSIDEEVDNTLIKTLEMIKRKDPAVYDKSFKAFPDDSLGFGKAPAVGDGADGTEAATGKLKKSKSDNQSVTLKDYFRAKLLAASEKGHADLDEIDRGDADDADAAAAAAAPASYHEEAAAAKKAFLSALDGDTGSAAAADDSWFVAKAKSAGQSQAETEEAKAFVAGLKGKKLAKGDRQFLDFIVSGEAVLNPQERWLRQYVPNPSHASLL
jgi:protein KRI1